MSGENSSGHSAAIETRLQWIAQTLDRAVPEYPPPDVTPEEQRAHLLEEAQQLYENELAWEEESGEEFTESGAVAALVFPGTLALIDALLSSHVPSERGEGFEHRDVVAHFMEFLAGRLLDLRSGQSSYSATDRAKQVDLTDRLLDLILHRYVGLSGDEVERLDAAR